jgi:hypothetical protein
MRTPAQCAGDADLPVLHQIAQGALNGALAKSCPSADGADAGPADAFVIGLIG